MSNTPGRTDTPRLLALLLVFATASVGSWGEPASDHERAILSAAIARSPAYTAPLTHPDGSPLALFVDLDGDEAPDVALLSITVDPRIEPRTRTLQDSGRLFDRRAIAPLFVLEAYFPTSDSWISVELGRHLIYESIESIVLSPASHAVGIRVRFRGERGRTSELVIFQQGRGVSRFALAEDRNEFGYMSDVTGDGALDAVVARRVPDAGRGFETFIELFELSSHGYTRSATLSVVRGLSAYLAAIAREIERREWETLAARISGGNGDLRADLEAAFRDVTDPDARGHDVDYGEGFRVDQVVFPVLSENPFPEPFLGESMNATFRVECCDGSPRFYTTRVQLRSNPFGDEAFALLTEWEPGR